MNFYVLLDQFSEAIDEGCFVERMEPYNLRPAVGVCSVCGASLEPAEWIGPHNAKVLGNACGDILLGAGFELVISEIAWEAFEACRITGWKWAGDLAAVKPMKSYVVVRPHVSITRLDEAASQLVWYRAPSCDNCRMGIRQRLGPVILDLTTLDGSDVFVPSGAYGLKIVSQRVVDCARKYDLSGFNFVAVEEYREPLQTA